MLNVQTFSLRIAAFAIMAALTLPGAGQPSPGGPGMDGNSIQSQAKPAPPSLSARFDETSITITGVTAGGSVVVVGLAREMSRSRPAIPRVVPRQEVLLDDDRNGEVRLVLPDGIPAYGMWAAIDLATGAHTAFPTPGYAPRKIDLVPELARKDNAGKVRKIEWNFSEMDLVLVRPQSGAWSLYASRNSRLDENRGTGKALRLDVARMAPIGDGPAPPDDVKNGDVIVIFDRAEMQYGILGVGK